MKNYVLLLIASVLFIMVACKKEKQLTEAKQHDVTSVTGSTTGTINTAITLTVTYPYSNGCDFIGSFEETRTGNTIAIKALSKPVAKDAICTQDAGSRTIDYQFKSSTAGTFELRFLKTDGTSVNHTVTIQ